MPESRKKSIFRMGWYTELLWFWFALGRRVKTQVKQIMMILLFLLLFTALATYYYIYHIKPKIKQTYNPNREAEGDNTNKGKQAELMLFYVDWCPHCKTAKPVWEELQNEYKNYVLKFSPIIVFVCYIQ